jgi:outer membrane lipoprotein carrier protein
MRNAIPLLLLALAAPAAAAVLTLSPAEVQADPLTAQDIGARVQQFYDASKTFRATFKQSYMIKAQGVQKVSTGTVTFEKPGKMSWSYAAPNGNRVVSDGTTIKVYEQENQQMYEMAVAKSQYPAALAFLMGKGQLTRDFTLRLLDPAQMKFEGGYVLEGTPKDATPAYQKVLLYVDAATNQVRRALILDAQGNRNRFDFDTPTVNNPIPPEEFNFTPPPGTKVIKP